LEIFCRKSELFSQVASLRPNWISYRQVRSEKYSVNEEEIKPYFTLDRMCEAIFDCAHKLFGLKFVLRSDIPVYHPDVKAYEVFRETQTDNGGVSEKLVGVFLHGMFHLELGPLIW
jgi:peptidyl-dipeptidase Dcp